MPILEVKPQVIIDNVSYDIVLISTYIKKYHNGKLTTPAIEKAILTNRLNAVRLERYTCIILDEVAINYKPNRYKGKRE
jgi:hypothetical protein